MATTMKTLRERQRAERLAHVAALLEEAGSVQRAAELAGMDRAYFRRVLRAGRDTSSHLTPPPPPATS